MSGTVGNRAERPVGRPRLALLPVAAVVVFALLSALIVIAGRQTLGYDFDAYWNAAQRLVHGTRLYDPDLTIAGGFAVFLYPPPFAVALAPLTVLPRDVALTLWEALLVLCMPIGARLLPVRSDVRWTILLLAGLNWPFLYSLRLGQVGPILFLLFALIWRAMDGVRVPALAIAAGALIKVQPGIVLFWALATRRWQMALWTVGFLVAASLAAAVVVGFSAWFDYLSLLSRVSSGLNAARNTSPGAIAYLAGAPLGVAGAVQLASVVAVAGAVLWSWRYASPGASLQITFLASQLLSPLLWEHYAVLLLIPTAWLLERGRAWAILFPLSSWIVVVAFATPGCGSGPAGSVCGSPVPAASIPLAFAGCLAVLLVEAFRDRRAVAPATRQEPGLERGAAD